MQLLSARMESAEVSFNNIRLIQELAQARPRAARMFEMPRQQRPMRCGDAPALPFHFKKTRGMIADMKAELSADDELCPISSR